MNKIDDVAILDIVDVRIIEKQQQEIERLKNIIKEVREYMEKTIQDDGEYLGYKSMYNEDYYKLLEILDKGE